MHIHSVHVQKIVKSIQTCYCVFLLRNKGHGSNWEHLSDFSVCFRRSKTNSQAERPLHRISFLRQMEGRGGGGGGVEWKTGKATSGRSDRLRSADDSVRHSAWPRWVTNGIGGVTLRHSAIYSTHDNLLLQLSWHCYISFESTIREDDDDDDDAKCHK